MVIFILFYFLSFDEKIVENPLAFPRYLVRDDLI